MWKSGETESKMMAPTVHSSAVAALYSVGCQEELRSSVVSRVSEVVRCQEELWSQESGGALTVDL